MIQKALQLQNQKNLQIKLERKKKELTDAVIRQKEQQRVSQLNRQSLGDFFLQENQVHLNNKKREKEISDQIKKVQPRVEVETEVEDVTVNESGFGDDVNQTVFGEMEMETQPQAPKKKPEVKTPLPTKKKPVGESELAKYLKTLDRDQGLSSRDKVAMGLALLTGREEGLTQASRAVAAGKGPASDLEVELKAIKSSNETEANKAKLAETLRKRAADRAKRTLEATKTGIEIQRLKLDISKSDDQAAIKLWESAGIIGQNELLKITEEERKTMTPELYAQKIRQAVASLKPRR